MANHLHLVRRLRMNGAIPLLLLYALIAATVPSPCGFGLVASRFFSVTLKVLSQGNPRRRSLQGPRPAATGWVTNTTLSFGFLCLFVAVHFRITSWNIITHYQVCPRHFAWSHVTYNNLFLQYAIQLFVVET